MKTLSTFVLLAAFGLLFGCTPTSTAPPADQHDHADAHVHHLESLAAGVEQLKGHRDQIKSAFESGNPHECDGALHEAVHVLEALPGVEDVTSMSDEDQDLIKATAKELFGLLGQIHDGFHGAGDVQTNAYEAVAADIDKALETLSSKVPASE